MLVCTDDTNHDDPCSRLCPFATWPRAGGDAEIFPTAACSGKSAMQVKGPVPGTRSQVSGLGRAEHDAGTQAHGRLQSRYVDIPRRRPQMSSAIHCACVCTDTHGLVWSNSFHTCHAVELMHSHTSADVVLSDNVMHR